MRTTVFDVAIVGARVGGSTLASLLGRRGLRVLLVDRADFPSDTLSTHLIYGDSFGVWEEIGAWSQIDRLGVTPLGSIHWRRLPPVADIVGPFLPVNGHPYALCIRRLLLDDILVRTAAETQGVTVSLKTTARELLWERGRVHGLRLERRGARALGSSKVRASLVVGADGRFSFVAGSVGAGEYNVVPPIWFPFYTYLRGVEAVDPPKLEILDSAEAKGTIMLAPCDDGIWMIILYSEQSLFEEFRRDHERVFRERVTADPRLTDRLARAELIAPVRGRGDLVNFMRVPAGPGWALVGDSGQHKDPIYGQGIGDAVRTARLLADHVVEALGGEGSFESLPAAFHEARDADLLPQYEWMIKGAPQGWAKAEFQAFLATLGEDPELSRQFVNLFSHGVMPQELFGRQPTDPERAVPTESLGGVRS